MFLLLFRGICHGRKWGKKEQEKAKENAAKQAQSNDSAQAEKLLMLLTKNLLYINAY